MDPIDQHRLEDAYFDSLSDVELNAKGGWEPIGSSGYEYWVTAPATLPAGRILALTAVNQTSSTLREFALPEPVHYESPRGKIKLSLSEITVQLHEKQPNPVHLHFCGLRRVVENTGNIRARTAWRWKLKERLYFQFYSPANVPWYDTSIGIGISHKQLRHAPDPTVESIDVNAEATGHDIFGSTQRITVEFPRRIKVVTYGRE